MNQVKGTTEECLKHYAATLPPKGSRHAADARMTLAEFCAVTQRTVERWVLRGQMPLGEQLIKLRFFLELKGYEVAELKRLSERLYKLAEMIAYDKLASEEAMTALGFNKVQSIYRLAHGGSDTTRERLEKIGRMWDERSGAVAYERDEWRERLGVPGLPAPVAEATPPSVSEHRVRPINFGHDSELETLGYLVLAALPLAEKVVSDNFSAEDRRMLREMTGGNAVFRLSNALDALCGEKAREQVLASSKKK